MKILQISTYDIRGGAARAAYRLHRGLREMGHECRMVARYKDTTDASVGRIEPQAGRYQDDRGFFLDVVIQGHYIDSHRTGISNTLFSLPYPGYDLSKLSAVQEADVINLHWVARYQSPLTLHRLFSLGKPVVWTLHDQWPFTGGCHYTAGCDQYKDACKGCPQLSDDPFGLPEAVLKDKMSFFMDSRLSIVTPSRWMANCARESSLFGGLPIQVIPNSVETDVFSPIPKREAKEGLGMSSETFTILFGAEYGTEKRKGLLELRSAIASCLEGHAFQDLVRSDRIKMLCFGNPGDDLSSMGIPVMSLGYLTSDKDVRLAYSAADVFVQASLEDNLPNTVLESMSCGTPVVAFDVGGMPDLIENEQTGQLVPFADTRQMGHALLSLLLDPDRRKSMGKECRRRMEKGYDLAVQARGYSRLYQELISERGVKGRRLGDESKVDSAVADSQTGASDVLSAPLEPGVGVHLNRGYGKIVARASREYAPYAHAKWQAAETDRNARLEVIEAQGARVGELEAERNELRSYTVHLRNQIEAIEMDRDARLSVIRGQSERISGLELEVDRWLGEARRLQDAYRDVEAERDGLRKDRETLLIQIERIEADRLARLQVIEAQGERLVTLESEIERRFWGKKLLQAFTDMQAERNKLRSHGDYLRQQIEACEADRAARLEVIETQAARISALESEVDRWLEESRRLQENSLQIEAERNALKCYGDHLRQQIEACEADRADRLEVIESQGERIASLHGEVDRWLGETRRLQEQYLQLGAEHNELQCYGDHLRQQIEVSEADRAARLEVIEAQGARIAELESQVDRWLGEIRSLQDIAQCVEGERDESRHSRRLDLGGLKAFETAVRRKLRRQSLPTSVANRGNESLGRPLALLKQEIDAFNNSQANRELLEDIRRFNHRIVDQFDENFPLKGCMLLDIGASPHGYAIERALEKGVACYVGIGLDIAGHEYVMGHTDNAGILLNMDATDLKFPNAFFDAIMSASVFEHISDVSAALNEIHRVLKPGGYALISFEPVWSCSYGHHLHHLAGCSGVIPPWAHLMWQRDRMEAFLADKWPPNAPLSVGRAVEWIYSGDAINRMNVRQFKELFSTSPLEILWMVELREESNQFDPVTIERCSNATGLDSNELTTKGLSVFLTKK